RVGQLAHLRAHAHGNAAAADQGRVEGQADAELLEDDGDGVLVLRDGNRKLTAREEACCFARYRREVRLGEDRHEIVVGQGIDERIDRNVTDVATGDD